MTGCDRPVRGVALRPRWEAAQASGWKPDRSDPAGRVASVTDAKGNQTTYGYDDAGRVVRETDPLGKAATYAYDAAGRPTGTTDRLGRRKDWA
ncbi:MAG: RHS repeat protein, partial [Gemmataceae bacterium]|nr:RHS repeat protein [Gemmataceae bacterium]